MEKSSNRLLAALILIVVFGAVIAGFELGFYRAASETSREISPDQSTPIAFGPFDFTFVFQGKNAIAYVPVVILAPGYSTQVYVEYDCGTPCMDLIGAPISSLKISSYTPVVYAVNTNGTPSPSNIVRFNSSVIMQEDNDSITMAYQLSDTGNNTGYYSFVFPFTCQLQPILYIGNHARSMDYETIQNWLEATHQLSQQCSGLGVELDVNLLSFTDALYNRIPLEFETG